MEENENRTFFTEVAFPHFPNLRMYLLKECRHHMATIDAWQKTLWDITMKEAMSVIDRWTRDELPRPTYIELGDFALHLRGVVLKDRADSRKSVVIDSIKDRGDISASACQVKLGPYYERIFDLSEKYRAGTIGLEEFETRRDEVIAEHSQAINKELY